MCLSIWWDLFSSLPCCVVVILTKIALVPTRYLSCVLICPLLRCQSLFTLNYILYTLMSLSSIGHLHCIVHNELALMSREVSGADTATAVRLCVTAQPPLQGCHCSCPHKDTAAVVLWECCDGCCLSSVAITALLLVVIGRSCVRSPKKNVTASARLCLGFIYCAESLSPAAHVVCNALVS